MKLMRVFVAFLLCPKLRLATLSFPFSQLRNASQVWLKSQGTSTTTNKQTNKQTYLTAFHTKTHTLLAHLLGHLRLAVIDAKASCHSHLLLPNISQLPLSCHTANFVRTNIKHSLGHFRVASFPASPTTHCNFISFRT